MNSTNVFDPLKYYIGPITQSLLFMTIGDKSMEEICYDLTNFSIDNSEDMNEKK